MIARSFLGSNNCLPQQNCKCQCVVVVQDTLPCRIKNSSPRASAAVRLETLLCIIPIASLTRSCFASTTALRRLTRPSAFNVCTPISQTFCVLLVALLLSDCVSSMLGSILYVCVMMSDVGHKVIAPRFLPTLKSKSKVTDPGIPLTIDIPVRYFMPLLQQLEVPRGSFSPCQ